MNETSGLSPATAGDTRQGRLGHALLQGFVLVAGIALLAFGLKLLDDYFSADHTAAAYRGVAQCEMPSATDTASCYSVVVATVTRVWKSNSRSGSSYLVDLRLPTGSQSVWLSTGPPPPWGTPVGAKVWRGRVTLISAPNRLIETTENPLWQKGDTLIHALLILGISVGLLLVFAWQWGAMPALAPDGSPTIETIGTIVGYDPSGEALTGRLVLRPARAPDMPDGSVFRSLGVTGVAIRLLLLVGFLLGAVVGNPAARHDRLIWVTALVGGLVAILAVAVVGRELFLLRSSLFADAQWFGTTNLLGIVRRYPRSQLQRIVIRSVDSQPAGTKSEVLFVSNTGSVLLRGSGRWWRRDQLKRLASFLKVQTENL